MNQARRDSELSVAILSQAPKGPATSTGSIAERVGGPTAVHNLSSEPPQRYQVLASVQGVSNRSIGGGMGGSATDADEARRANGFNMFR
jgi:hypothetical protein